MGCPRFREKFGFLAGNVSGSGSLQTNGVDGGSIGCGEELKLKHVSVLVKGWTWIPDNMENLYYCRCGLSCLWTKSSVLADHPDALLFETTTPPLQVFFYLFLPTLIVDFKTKFRFVCKFFSINCEMLSIRDACCFLKMQCLISCETVLCCTQFHENHMVQPIHRVLCA